MHLKASTDYGMRAVLYLAAQGTTCSSKDIAEDMDIPRDYLIPACAAAAQRGGIIEARPGKHGGYLLAKKPEKISVLDILSALEEDKRSSKRSKRSSRKGQRNGGKAFAATYDLVEESMNAFLDSLTVEALLACALRRATATRSSPSASRTREYAI